MRKILSTVLACLCVFAGREAAGAPAAAAAEKPLLFVYRDVCYGQIVVADLPDHIGINHANWRLDRTRTTRYAAEFLQRYVERVTGRTMPIVSESVASAGRPLVCVGRSSLTAFAEEDRRKLPPEGFILRRKGRVVAIVGETTDGTALKEYRDADRGTLFGVMEFLERVCGVRWYFPHELGFVVPSSSLLQVDKLDITASPFFPMRTGAVYNSDGTGEYADPLPVIRSGNSTGFHANHTHYGWYVYAKEHPELFAVGPDGIRMTDPSGPGGNKYNHLCYSNPGVLETEMRHLKEFDEGGIRRWDYSLEPSDRYVRFAPKDLENIFYCHCPACKAQWDPDAHNSVQSNVVLGYAARLADEIAKRTPGRRLATLAYSGFLFPPSRVKIPANLDVMICTVMGNMKLSSPGHWRYTTDCVDRWFETVGRDPKRLYLFEYLVYPSVDAPALYPRTMKRWFQFLKGKVSGGFNNGYNPKNYPMNFRFSLVNGWLWHKLLWNPDADVEALLNGFYKDLFGPAEGPMKRLFTLTIDAWENAPWGNDVNPGGCSAVNDRFLFGSVYPKATVAKMRELLAEGRKAAPAGSVHARRVEYFAEAYEEFFRKAAVFQKAAGDPPRRRAARAVAPLKIDGGLDEAAWKGAEPVALAGMRRGEDPAAATTVRILQDDERLYVGATMEVPDSAKLVARATGRDDPAAFRDDRIEIDLDLRRKEILDIPRFYRIVVTAGGAIADGVATVPLVINAAHHSAWDEFWSPPGVTAAVRKDAGSWTVEAAIPFAAFPECVPRPPREIRMQITRRNVSAPGGAFSWSPTLVESYEYDLDRMAALLLD